MVGPRAASESRSSFSSLEAGSWGWSPILEAGAFLRNGFLQATEQLRHRDSEALGEHLQSWQTDEQIPENLEKLRERGVVTPDYVEAQRSLSEELRAGINYVILNKLYAREEEGRLRFGKVRAATEAGEKAT